MDSSTVETTAIALLVVSCVVIFSVFLVRMVGVPGFVWNTKAQKARERLRAQLRTTSTAAGNTVIYWDRYRHLSKLEVFAIAGEFGWLYTGQRFVPEGWALEFVKDGQGAP